ncbi:hypothetical protein KJA15_00595 [Patescibacteria group bacterium]|nr:hypothetical protein [Patescibacteria group bacterium]
MTKKARTILFLICLFLFLISVPLIVFYSQGYRFDFDSKKIVQTGAFYFKVWPKSVQIYLDGKLEKKTDFFFGSALIKDLLPKKYDVEIKKSGFHSWKKILQIKEKEVTEVKSVFLIPENPKFTILTKETENFFFSPDERKIILEEVDEKGWNLKLLELDRNVKSHLFEEKDFSKEKVPEVEFLDLEYSLDSKKILLKTREKERIRTSPSARTLIPSELKYWIVDLEKIPVNLISLDFLGRDIEKISFNPRDSQKIFFISKNSLFEANFIKRETNQILENLITYETSDRNIYLIDNNGFFLKTDLLGQSQEKLNLEPLPLKEEVEYQLCLKSPRTFLKENDILHIFNPDSKNFEKFFESIKDFKFSPDLKKMVFFSDYEIWVFFLEEKYGQPRKKTGERIFLTRFSEKIRNCFWYTPHYLIFNAGSVIKIAEIDDRDRINIVDLANLQSPEIFWNESNKKLYVLSDGNLYVSEMLIK